MPKRLPKHPRPIILMVIVLAAIMPGIQPIRAGAQGAQPTPQRVLIQIIAPSVSIRSGPGEDYPVIGTVKKGGKILLSGISADGDWFVFKYANGQGWIPSGAEVSKFLEGTRDDLPVVDVATPTPTSTPTPRPVFSRAKLKPLSGRTDCRKRSIVKPASTLASRLNIGITRLNRQDLDGAIVQFEKALDDWLKTSDITDCLPNRVLCEGGVGRAGCYFEVATLMRNLIDELIIGSLYIEAGQDDAVQAHADRVQALGNEMTALGTDLQANPYTQECTDTPAQTLTSSIYPVYEELDTTLGEQLDANDFEDALSTIESVRNGWMTISDLQNCSPTLVKLSALTENMLDETLISVLYLHLGDDALFKKHAGRAIRSAQYINGLLPKSR